MFQLISKIAISSSRLYFDKEKGALRNFGTRFINAFMFQLILKTAIPSSWCLSFN